MIKQELLNAPSFNVKSRWNWDSDIYDEAINNVIQSIHTIEEQRMNEWETEKEANIKCLIEMMLNGFNDVSDDQEIVHDDLKKLINALFAISCDQDDVSSQIAESEDTCCDGCKKTINASHEELSVIAKTVLRYDYTTDHRDSLNVGNFLTLLKMQIDKGDVEFETFGELVEYISFRVGHLI